MNWTARTFLTALLALATTTFIGCRKGSGSDAGAKNDPKKRQADAGIVQPGANPIKQQKPKPNVKPKSGLPRAFQIQEVQNLMKQLGLAYHNYIDVHRKGPPDYKALSPFYEKNPKITKMLSDGYWKFYYNVNFTQMRNGTSNTVVAHEAYADNNGRRVVLFGDGSVRLMPEADFLKKPKAGQN